MKTSLRYLAVIFAVAMMVLTLVSVSAASFTDVTAETPHVKAIDSLTGLGILHGYEDNTFRPDLPVRRNEMAKLVFTTFTTTTDAGSGAMNFPDVPANNWARGYISWCVGKNIIGGYEDGTFRPDSNVTYDEALKMVCAMLGYTDFKSELWPTDVRMKALLDLNLGEKLSGVAGDAQLTRAQVAQLFHNALDEQMYIAPVDEEELIGGIFLPSVPKDAPSTLAGDVWGYSEVTAEIVATESYGLKIPYKLKAEFVASSSYNSQGGSVQPENVEYYTYSKLEKDDVIKVRFYDEKGKLIMNGSVPKTDEIKLEDVNLSEYEGKTDDLLAMNIVLLLDKKGEYMSATLKGKKTEGLTGSYADTAGIPATDLRGTYDPNPNPNPSQHFGHIYTKYGVKIDGVNYYYDNFQKLRRMVFLPDGTVLLMTSADGSGNLFYDKNGKIINEYRWHSGTGAPDTQYKIQNFVHDLTQRMSNPGYKFSIDANGDNRIDYIQYTFDSAYRVKSVTKTQITIVSLYSTDLELTYKLDKFNAANLPVKDDIIVGYIFGDTFTMEAVANKITAFSTKYIAGSQTTSLYGYGTYAPSGKLIPNAGGSALTKVVNALGLYVGYDEKKGDYNYATYYLYDGGIIYAEVASEADKAGALAGNNKAILQFVDKPTEPQINEKTKQYEIFYPAYLIINGKEELVNLKPTSAINGTEAETVAQDGTWYRASIDPNGTVMYPNLLVTFEVDSDGYYSLTTSGGVDKDLQVDGNGVVIEKVIGANGYFLTIDEKTGFMSVVDENDTVIESKIIVDGSSVLYYPYTKKTTGAHEYIDFYLGNDIPENFEKIELIGDTYLERNEEGLFIIKTTMLALEGFNSVGTDLDEHDYNNDARLHLLSLMISEAEYDEVKKDVFATYKFKGIYEGTDVEDMNKYASYDDVTHAEIGKLYAWDSKDKDYVEITTALNSYTEDAINFAMVSNDVLFTDANETGYKVEEDTKLLAITSVIGADGEGEYLFEEITIEDIDAVLTAIADYNEYYNDGADYKLGAKIGTYVDENRETRLAYVIIDWVEYDEELDEYTFAGETK